MPRRNQPELIPGTPVLQSEYQIVNVSIRELCEQSERFNISPEYQREDVWTLRQSQQLIDTILSGLGIGLLEGYKYQDLGKTLWEISDGHQRLSTILRFYDNGFRTWTPLVKQRMQPISKRGPVEGGRHYDQLSGYVKDFFLDYHVPISKMPEKMSLEDRISRFLCIQCQTSLSPAERLYIYPSKANAAAKVIANSSFWSNFYIGEMGRRQLHLSSLYLMALQMAPNGMVDFKSGRFIPALASGEYDDVITDNFTEAVENRLDDISCVYSGMQFTERAASIAMYQSIIFLERAGCTVRSSTHKGRLTGWMSSVIEASKHASGLPAYHQPIHRLLNTSGQEIFWERNLKIVLNLFGISEQE